MSGDAASGRRRRRSGLAALAFVAFFAAAFWIVALLVADLRDRIAAPRAAVPTLPASGPITIALTGDTSLIATATSGTPFDEVADLVRRATIGFTNVERFGAGAAAPLDDTGDASALRSLGFDVVSIANNHTMDRAEAGLASWLRGLAAAGVRAAGAGPDLDAARKPATIAGAGRSVAVVAVTTSVAPEAIAMPTRSDIRGRAGVSPLRYTAQVTVDADTFRTIAGSIAALNAGPPPGEHELTMFGTTIRKGDRTEVSFTVNDSDRAEVLDVVRAARTASEVVVVSLHAHEPSNASEAPAAFVREFARAAIDAGAQIVVGHGPHRIRGMELHGGGAIFYSLGHFSYDVSRGGLREADPFDAGADLYRAALRTPGGAVLPAAQLDDQTWWEGLLVTATLEAGTLRGVVVRALDLGLEQPFNNRGRPGLAEAVRAEAILRHFAKLSGDQEALIGAHLNRGVLDLPISESR